MTVLLPPAPHARRALAWLADLALVGLVALLFTALVYVPDLLAKLMGENEPLRVDARWFVPFAALYFIAYSTTSTWLTGCTAGKAMFGLRVRRAERRSGFFWALGRASFGYAVIDVFGAGALLALWNPRHRGLHDLVFGSEVVLERGEPIRPGVLWSGLLGFEAERRAASEEKTKSLRILKGFVRYLLKLTFPLAWLLEHLKGRAALAAPAPAPIASVATLSAKATVAVVAATTAITSAVVARAPDWTGPRRISFPTTDPVTTSSSSTTGPAHPSVSTSPPDPRRSPGPETTLVASPTALDFGDQTVGASSPEHRVELTNRGTREVPVKEVKVTGADPDEFSATMGSCRGASIGPGATCRLSLRFTPGRVGGSSAILAIRSGSTGDALLVALIGSGSSPGPAPSAHADPTRLDFGERPVGTSSDRRTVVVANDGTEPLFIRRVGFSGGDTQDFDVAESCSGASVSPGGSCPVRILFSPTAAGGRSASLRIDHDAGESPLTVALSGTGRAADPVQPKPGPTDGDRPAQQSTRIPQCAGMAVGDCEVTLRDAGLVPEQAAESSDSVRCGTVLGTDPRAGSSVPARSKVTMRVSSGPARAVIASGLRGAIGSRYDAADNRLVFVEFAGKLSAVSLDCSHSYAVLGTGYDRPEDIALSRDGRTAYVTERGGSFLRVDLSNAGRGAATVVASGLSAPHQIVLDESRGVAYTVEFAEGAPGRVVRINLASGAVTRVADVKAGIGLLLSGDRRTAYVTEQLPDGTGQLISIDLASGTRRVLFTSSTATLFDLSWTDATEQAVYVPERDPANQVWLVDLAGKARLVAENLAGRPSSVTVVSPGGLLICSDSQITELSVKP